MLNNVFEYLAAVLWQLRAEAQVIILLIVDYECSCIMTHPASQSLQIVALVTTPGWLVSSVAKRPAVHPTQPVEPGCEEM